MVWGVTQLIIQLNYNAKDLYQYIESNITVNGETKRVRFELRYLYATEKWYLSMFNAQTGESYFRYVPLISSYKDANNLLSPFQYKDVGIVFCLTTLDEPSSVNPKEENLDEFLALWGDALVQ